MKDNKYANTKEDKGFQKWLTRWSIVTVCLILVVFVGTIIVKDIMTPDPITVQCRACNATLEGKKCEDCGTVTQKESTCPYCYTTVLMFGCPGCAETAPTTPEQ